MARHMYIYEHPKPNKMFFMWILLIGFVIGLGIEAYRQHKELADFIHNNEKNRNLPQE